MISQFSNNDHLKSTESVTKPVFLPFPVSGGWLLVVELSSAPETDGLTGGVQSVECTETVVLVVLGVANMFTEESSVVGV